MFAQSVSKAPTETAGPAEAIKLEAFGSSEELFRALTSHTPVGVFVSDARGACVYVNARYCELTGLRVEEALGDGWTRALHPDDADRVLGEWAEAGSEGRDSVVEYRFSRPDGGVVWIRGFAAALRDGDGKVVGWTGTCLDLTADRRRERQQQALADFGVRTLSTRESDVLLQDAVDTLATGLEAGFASFLELQPDGHAMRLRAGSGYEFESDDVLATAEMDSPAMQALEAAGPVLVEHAADSSGRTRGRFLTRLGVASSAAMVVRGAELPCGVLAAHSRRPGAFSEQDLFFLRGVANMVAAGLGRLRSEARSRAVLDSALDGVITIDRAGAIVEFNPAAEAMFGRRREDVLGRQMTDALVPPSLRERHRRGFARAAETGEGPILGRRIELSALHADGTEFPVELTVNVVNVDGPALFTAFVRDITERRQAESEQRRLAAIVGAADDAIFSTTADGVITSWNNGAELIYGWPAEEVLGRSAWFMVPAERRHESEEIVDRLHAGERIRHYETVRVRKDGTRFDVALTVSPIQDATGSTAGLSVIAQDITKRKEAEAQLRQSEARYRDLFENATDLIATVDLDARFTDVNRAFANALGYTRDELIGRPLGDVAPPESLDALRGRGNLAHDADIPVFEHELMTKDGRRVEVEVSSRLIAEDDQPVGIEAICRDIRERKRLEAQLRQAQKMEAIGKLAGGIAHDFNNLLTVINGNAERALGFDDIDAVKRSLGPLLKAGTSAAALTRQLLAFSRLQVLQPRILNLDEVLTSMEPLLDHLLEEDIRLEKKIALELGNVRVDPNQFEQVLLNLVVNARDAMPAGGSIRLALENVDVDAAYASAIAQLEPGRYVELTVSDTGAGMDEETRSHIFEPFFTTKEEGTGLGLATAYGIVKQSGGHISVYSEPGSGTTFRILLPRVEGVFEHNDVSTVAPADLSGTETILVIEDNELVRTLTAEILSSLGYNVLTAGSASDVHEHMERAEPIDLVVSDVMLPGQPGPELVASLRERHTETKCLFTSGYAAGHVGERGGFESGLPFLAKPFTTIELASLVRKILDG